MKLTKEKLMELIGEAIQESEGFSPSQTPAEADKTFSDCMEKVKKKVKPRDGDTKEEAAAKICTDSRKSAGATLDWGKEREKKVQKERPGGKSGNED